MPRPQLQAGRVGTPPSPRIACMLLLSLLSLTFCEIAGAYKAPSELHIAPSAQTGLLVDVGDLSPHSYRPNEFFANDWVFEGLVRASGSEILPALAESWSERQTGTGVTITFALRRGVTFHDGSPWDATVAVANFDNVLAPPLRSGDYHGWFGLVDHIKAWRAVDNFTFELELSIPYYPVMQELSFIRPLRMLSKQQMKAGNTCPRSWGVVAGVNGSVTCEGIIAPAGTGPYKFDKKVTSNRTIGSSVVADTAIDTEAGERVLEIHFVAHESYWGGAPAVDRLVVHAFSAHEEVLAALMDGRLDMAYGSGTLRPEDFVTANAKAGLRGHISPPVNTRLIAINSARDPTSSLAVRKAIIHAVNKADIVQRELQGLEHVAHSVFASNIPYADVPLFPLLDYDAEKAALLLESDGWQAAPGNDTRVKDGQLLVLEFIYLEDDATKKAVEDDIRADLAKLGIQVVAVPLAKEEWNERAAAGDFHLAFSTSWGSPYDPHSFASAWRVPNEGDFAAQQGMRNDDPSFKYPMNKSELDDTIGGVLVEMNQSKRADMWRAILHAVHEQAVYLPLTYKVNVAVVREGVTGFQFGTSEFDIPVRQLSLAGQADASVAAQGSTSGLSAGAIVGIVMACVVAATAVAAAVFLVVREKRGKPVFAPLLPQGNNSA